MLYNIFYCIRLQHPDVFRLIAQHNLFSAVHDKILALMELDVNQACTLFLEHSDHITPDLVVSRLQAKPQLLYKVTLFDSSPSLHWWWIINLEYGPIWQYVDALYHKEPKDGSRKFHGMLVTLYADYAKEKLLSFLRSSDHYPIQDALDTCQQRGYIPEMIFLLGNKADSFINVLKCKVGILVFSYLWVVFAFILFFTARMGNTRDALRLIMRQLKDIDQAIEFCKTYDDSELWEQLIGYSLAKPGTTTPCLVSKVWIKVVHYHILCCRVC